MSQDEHVLNSWTVTRSTQKPSTFFVSVACVAIVQKRLGTLKRTHTPWKAVAAGRTAQISQRVRLFIICIFPDTHLVNCSFIDSVGIATLSDTQLVFIRS